MPFLLWPGNKATVSLLQISTWTTNLMNVINILQVAIGTVCNGHSSPPVGLHLTLTDVDTVSHQCLKIEVLNTYDH